MKIGDGHDFEALVPQVLHHAFEIGEPLPIDRERTIVLLVVNVQINYIGGNFTLAKLGSDLAHLRLWIIAVPALLVSQRKQRRERHSTDKLAELLHYLLGSRSVKKIVVQLPALRAERIRIADLFAEIKAGSISVVEENAVCRAVAKREQERDVFVKRIGGLLPSEGVGVPHGEREIAVVHRPGLVSQAKIMFIFRHGFPDPKRGGAGSLLENRRSTRWVLRNNLARCILKHNPQRRFFHADKQRARLKGELLGRVLHLEYRRLALKSIR